MVASIDLPMLIICSKLITCKASVSTVIDKGAVLINKGTIQSTGSAEYITKRFPGHRVINLPNAVLMPGLINAHAHLELPPHLLNPTRSKTFPDWILDLIHAKRGLRQKDYTAAAAENISALIKTGTTAVGEICTHGASPGLLKQNGLRAVVFQEIIGMGQKVKIRLPFRPHSALVKAGCSPHSPYTVSEQIQRSISNLSRHYGIRVTMHLAESVDELRLLQGKKSGLEKIYQFAKWDLSWAPKDSSPVEYLKRIGFLSPRFLAVHCVQLTDRDIRSLKKSGTTVAHCPRSNKILGVGRMPLKKMLDAGIPVGLGTDSLASSPSLSMWDEMRYALHIHKKDGINAKDIFYLATRGSAKALGMDKKIGTIELGKQADIIALPLPKKNTGDLYSDLLRETKSCMMTMVNGKMLYQNERLFPA